jgi:hypothetical protein
LENLPRLRTLFASRAPGLEKNLGHDADYPALLKNNLHVAAGNAPARPLPAEGP